MLSISAYFSIVLYNQTVTHAGQAEMQKLKSIVKTFAAELESVHSVEDKALHNKGGRSHIIADIEESLFGLNRINELERGVSVILIDPSSSQTQWIGAETNEQERRMKAFEIDDGQWQHSYPIKIGLDHQSTDNQILYAFPVALNARLRAFIVAEEDITGEIGSATDRLLSQSLLCLIFIAIIGFFGYRMLRKTLRHEVLAKQQLKEYAELAEQRNSELETLSTVLQKSENLILLTDNTGKIEWLNEVYHKKNNYNEEELESFVGKELAEVSHFAKIKTIIDEVNTTRKKLVYEAKSYDSDKNEFWASTTVTPILDKNNEVERLLFIDSDITQLKRAEKEIEQLANFTQENSHPVIRVKSDFTILYGNDSSNAILRHWNSRVHQKVQRKSVVLAIQKALLNNEEQTLNMACENRLYKMRIFPVPEKEYVNIYGEDITEVQQAEKASRARTLKLEQHNLNITDSINYARRIQEAILPDEDHIRQYFKNSFALNKPKDIVSGDFFWIHEVVAQEEYLIALADCTGHGVPGAMMSIVGHSLLNDIVEKENTQTPAEILTQLNREIIKSLRQKSQETTSDGMDVSIVHINLKKLEVTFSGAYQHLYWMNGSLNVFKGDRQPIGGLHHDNNRVFTNHNFKITKGDSLYLLSDGYVDQFGGPKNKKFLSRRLSELIESSHKYSMQAQSFIYNNTFEEWRGSNEQIDDVSLIGIKF